VVVLPYLSSVKLICFFFFWAQAAFALSPSPSSPSTTRRQRPRQSLADQIHYVVVSSALLAARPSSSFIDHPTFSSSSSKPPSSIAALSSSSSSSPSSSSSFESDSSYAILFLSFLSTCLLPLPRVLQLAGQSCFAAFLFLSVRSSRGDDESNEDMKALRCVERLVEELQDFDVRVEKAVSLISDAECIARGLKLYVPLIALSVFFFAGP
jgi:hypothetical protein